MQQYIYGNIEHRAYAYVSSEPEFFANAQRAAVLSHLMSYDVFCGHGELAASEHQSFWMVASNLDNPSAPDRLYLQASGGDPHRTGFYVRGYLSDGEDGYLYDSRLLQLLRSAFAGFEETMAEAQANSLKRIGWEEIPVQRELQPAALDPELLRNVLLALLRKKKVIIRIPAVGKEAMRMSREYILAIYERLPYEQRKVHGFVTGISAAKLNDKNALPKAVTLMLMDGDADLGGLRSDMFMEVFDLAAPNAVIRPMVRENRGKKMAYVALMDFLAEQSPEELDAFFRFCRSCMKDNVDGNNLGIQDYTMYLDFFNIGKTEFTDDAIRTWAANIYVNARNNEKWTPDVRKVLFERIAEFLPAARLEAYLHGTAKTFDDLKNFGVLGEGELKRILAAGGDAPVQDQNAALTLAMAEALLKFYPEGTREQLQQALLGRFVTLGCQQYPCLTEEKPTAATVAQLQQILLPEGGKKTTPLVTAVKEQVNGEINRLRAAVQQNYETRYNAQYAAGIARISEFPGGELAELSDLYARLEENDLFAELIAVGEKPNWNGPIGDRITAFCQAQVVLDAAGCTGALDYVNRTCRCFQERGGQLSEQQKEQIRRIADGWRFLLELHKPGNPDEKMAMLDGLERIRYQLDIYSGEAWQILVRGVFTAFVEAAIQVWPALVEEKPRRATAEALDRLQFPEPFAEETKDPCIILREKIYDQLRTFRSETGAEYAKQYDAQQDAGLARIAAWPETADTDIDALYDGLRELYLYDELIVPGGKSRWNEAIADRIAACCVECDPKSLEDYTTALKCADRFCQVFAENQGVIPPETEEKIQTAKAGWNKVLALSEKDCTTVEALLTLFADVRQTPMDTALALELKTAYTKALLRHPIGREQIFSNWKNLCGCCGDAQERQLLKQVVDACAGLKEIGRMSLENLTICLKIFGKLEKAGLFCSEIRFHPWKIQTDAGALLKRISALESYRTGDPEPDLTDDHIRNWVTETLTGNADLMFLVAMKYPGCRPALIPLLAKKPDAVTRDQILALYVAGCPKAMLCRGAAEKTAQSWSRHVDELFPGWVELPEPIRMTLPSGLEKLNLLLIPAAVLLAVAGILPAVLMLLMDAFSMMVCIGTLAVLVIGALLAVVISLVAGKKPQKRFLWIMAAALIPGIVATIVYLVMNLM